MADNSERILAAVEDVRESQRCMIPKIDAVQAKVNGLDTKVTGHLAYHNGVEKTEAKAVAAGAQTTARVGVAGAWLKVGLAALAMLVAAILFVATGMGASERERPDEVRELSAKIDSLVDAMETSRLTRGP